jgi:phosphoglycolate phosphatase-like HAD superfamily hydrolase
MKNIKLFIWDFDGTLMDTYPNLTGYMQRALLDVGHNVSRVEILEQMLDNIGQAVKFFSEKFEIADLSERFDKYYTAGIDDPAELFDDVVEVLQAIRDMGAKNLIFTNRGDSIFPMLEEKGIVHLFDEVVTSTHPNFAWKPAPDAIFYLMEKYGGTTENTVMIGDRVCDLGSAWNAGCKTCHLLTPAVPQYPPCSWRIRNFAEMLTLLK